MRGKVEKENPKKEMNNRRIFMTSHMTFSRASQKELLIVCSQLYEMIEIYTSQNKVILLSSQKYKVKKIMEWTNG